LLLNPANAILLSCCNVEEYRIETSSSSPSNNHVFPTAFPNIKPLQPSRCALRSRGRNLSGRPHFEQPLGPILLPSNHTLFRLMQGSAVDPAEPQSAISGISCSLSLESTLVLSTLIAWGWDFTSFLTSLPSTLSLVLCSFSGRWRCCGRYEGRGEGSEDETEDCRALDRVTYIFAAKLPLFLRGGDGQKSV